MKIIPAIFEEREIRSLYDDKTETWFFSVVDIVQVLTQQPDFQTARKYWNKLKERLAKEGSQLLTNCNQLKLPAADGKKYLTDVANAETLLRLVQSVPSPKSGTDQTLARQSRLRTDASGRMARSLLALCGLAGGMLAGGSLLCGQDQPATGEVRRSIRDDVAAALESGANDEAKSALVKALATKWLAEDKDAAIQTMLESIRATGNEELAVRIFRDFLADTALAIPAACALPDANDAFFKAVEAGRAGAIREWIGASLREAGEPTVRQMTALTAPPAWLGEGFVKWLTHVGMLGEHDPRAGGRLAARVLLLMEWCARPKSRTIQADYLERQMESAMNEGDVARMTAYFAGVAEVCPVFAAGGDWDRTVAWPMANAWSKRLTDVAKKEDTGAGADWRNSIEACFLTLARKMTQEERTFVAMHGDRAEDGGIRDGPSRAVGGAIRGDRRHARRKPDAMSEPPLP